MVLKRFLAFLILTCLLALNVEDISAQKRGKKKRVDRSTIEEEEKEPSSLSQKLVYEIGYGMPFLFGGVNGSQFNFALKPSVGYKFYERITAGIFVKGDYTWANLPGFDEFTLFDIGNGIYSRFKVLEQFYLRGELVYASYQRLDLGTGLKERINFTEPMLGVGYINGGNRWNFGAEFNFHLNRDLRNTISQVGELWLKADYNF